MKEEARIILMADMNAFFASCHQSINPTLRNKPIIVGGSLTDKRKGLVIACSYEAKRKGVYTTQSVYQARKCCPDAISVQRDHSLYHNISSKIMEFLRLIGPTEVASIDEAYIDITERSSNGPHPIVIARYIQETLWEKIHIPCSIGIGPNKIISKMASEVKKPQGIVQMGVKQFMTYYHPRPLNELYGCGAATEERLAKNGMKTIGDLAKADLLVLRALLGKRGELLHQYANGRSSSAVDEEREKGDKTIGKETTFNEDTADSNIILGIAKQMVQRLSARLQEKNKKARTVSIVYKTERIGRSYTKSITLSAPTHDASLILQAARTLYLDHLNETPIRLFGIRLSNLDDTQYDQLSLLDLDLKY